MVIRRLCAAVAVVAALTATACSTDTTAPAAAPATSVAAAAPGAQPTTLTFPAAGVDEVQMRPTGLDASGALEVPPVSDPGTVVWLRWSERLAPGRPTVIAAHVSGRDADGRAVEGAFFRLRDAEAGDELVVGDTSGRATTYVVREVRQVDKDAFPTDLVYGPRPGKWLVAVTCGGALDRAAHSYEDNVLVFAEAVR